MTRRLVDPELLPALDGIPSFDVSAETLHDLRAGLAGFLPPPESYARADVAIEHRVVPGEPDVPVIVYRPAGPGPHPVYLAIHGGGYVLGSAADTGMACVRTAAEVGCIVVSPDYRLAPEAPAPAAVEDCHRVLQWLHAEADALGIDRARIAVGGESAGAGLAAALALLARDRGSVPLCFQLLIYPMLDDRTVTRPGGNPHVGEFVWTRQANAFGWRSLLAREPGGEGVSPYAAAARAEDLSGLPPAYVSVGALDLFLEEDLDYARRLMHAGVPVELHVWPGAFHGYEIAAGADVSIRSEAERRAALRRAFA